MGCRSSKESPTCEKLRRLFIKRPTRSTQQQHMVDDNANAGPHRATGESQRGRSELANDNQHPLLNDHADPGAFEVFDNVARPSLNATAAEERQGYPEPRILPRIEMAVNIHGARQPVERTSLSPTAEGSQPQRPGSLTGSSTPTYDKRVLGLIDTLRLRVERFVSDSYNLPSEVDRSHVRVRIYRPVIDLVQDDEHRENPRTYRDVAKEIEEDLEDFRKHLFRPPSRTNSDLLGICETGKNIKEIMAHDEGSWKFEWETQGRKLEFPCSKRDEMWVDRGVDFKGTSHSDMESEQA